MVNTTTQPATNGAKPPTDAGASQQTEVRARDLVKQIRDLPRDEQLKIRNQLMEGLSPDVRGRIWTVVMTGLVIVMVGSFITLAVSLYVAAANANVSQIILTMFTSALSTLAGIFVPSPVADQGGQAGNG